MNHLNATLTNNINKFLGSNPFNSTHVINQNGHITIDARSGNDRVNVTQRGNILTILVNGQDQVSLDLLKTKSITLDGGIGNDLIAIDKNVTYPLQLKGGLGQDTILANNPGRNRIINDSKDNIHAKGTDYVQYGRNLNQMISGTPIRNINASVSNLPPPNVSVVLKPIPTSVSSIQQNTIGTGGVTSSISGVAANETATVWGDPHFVDPDGGKFDVQGEPGKTYNLLNDTGIAFNGRFDAVGNGTTVVGQTGLTLSGLRGSSQIQFSKEGATINGQKMMPGSMEALADGGHAQLSQDGKSLTVMTGEGYTISQKLIGERIDTDVKSPRSGVATDRRMPGGLLGQTFDADKIARNSSGKQGEGAIAGSVKNYEVTNGIFGGVPGSVQQGVPQRIMDAVQTAFQFANLTPPVSLPTTNPVNGVQVDWSQALASLPIMLQNLGINSAVSNTTTDAQTGTTLNPSLNSTDQTLDFLLGQSTRSSTMQQISDSNRKNDKLLKMLMACLQSGNIDMAMLLFSTLESREATELTKSLTQQLVKLQEQRRGLTSQMTSQNNTNGQNNLSQIQASTQEVNDTLQILTSFIKDVNEQKNRTAEFANNFLSNEHQATMSIIRSMRG